MKSPLAGVGALLLIVGGARAQSTATQGGGAACPAGSTSPSTCGGAAGSDVPLGQDLTPTQWLFGRDAFTKLSQPQVSALAAAQTHTDWAPALAHAAEPLPQRGHGSRSDPTVAKQGPGDNRESPVATQRFLIEEWRRTELDVADSVHRANLERMAVTFDSAQQAGIRDADRARILQRLDQVNRANEYTWRVFRAQIDRRADSAIAGLPASGNNSR